MKQTQAQTVAQMQDNTLKEPGFKWCKSSLKSSRVFTFQPKGNIEDLYSCKHTNPFGLLAKNPSIFT
uniref:Uncharacterized protein n=1 Tax=Nelumbo nucifera TaxID=4432 RepID=A0A822XZX8_NELNU|nr:TPA_asm: hypothetical protein HUJ06_026020 [Nelumbo nucifera]